MTVKFDPKPKGIRLGEEFRATGQDWSRYEAKASEHQSGFSRAIRMWLLPFTRIHRLPVFKRVWLYIICMAGYTVLVSLVANDGFPSKMFREAGAAAYSSIILGLLLVFRTNSAYERWWEGRKLWGQLVNDSRNLCMKVRACPDVPNHEKTHIGELVISFSYALKHHLRSSKSALNLPGVGKNNVIDSDHMPVVVATKINDQIWQWYAIKRIDGFNALMLDQHVKALMDICGACERIKTSPLAVSYRAFMRQGIALNLLALPWYIAPDVTILWSLPVILIASYFLIGLELIAEDIEDPFGVDGDDLPLDQICDGIKRRVNEILAVPDDQSFTASYVMPHVDPLKEH